MVAPRTSYDRDELVTADGLFHFHPDLEGQDLQAQLAYRAKELQSIIDETRKRHHVIRGQIRHTEQEKMTAIAELMGEVAGDVRSRIRDLLGLDAFEKHTSLLRELRSPDRHLDLPPQFKHEKQTGTMEREIRDEVRKLPEMDIRGTLYEAVNDDDRITLRAFRFCPPRFPLVKTEDLEDAMEKHSRRLFPEQWGLCDSLGHLWSLCRTNFEQFCSILFALAGPGGDAIMAQLRVESFLPESVTTEPNRYLDPALARPAG